MSSSESSISSESDSISNQSDEFYALEVEEEGIEGARAGANRPKSTDQDVDVDEDEDGPHQFDPLADEAFIAEYERDIEERGEEERRLLRSFEGAEPLESW